MVSKSKFLQKIFSTILEDSLKDISLLDKQYGIDSFQVIQEASLDEIVEARKQCISNEGGREQDGDGSELIDNVFDLIRE